MGMLQCVVQVEFDNSTGRLPHVFGWWRSTSLRSLIREINSVWIYIRSHESGVPNRRNSNFFLCQKKPIGWYVGLMRILSLLTTQSFPLIRSHGISIFVTSPPFKSVPSQPRMYIFTGIRISEIQRKHIFSSTGGYVMQGMISTLIC